MKSTTMSVTSGTDWRGADNPTMVYVTLSGFLGIFALFSRGEYPGLMDNALSGRERTFADRYPSTSLFRYGQSLTGVLVVVISLEGFLP